MRKIQAVIHLKSIYENAVAFKALTGRKLCAVVKADAYGHGAEQVALAIESVVDVFAVALLSEALALRVAACGKDILILTPPTCLAETVQAVQNGFIVTVGGIVDARLVEKAADIAGRPARVHMKVNTGMNRYGMGASELGKTCKFLKGKRNVNVEGMYSHLFSQHKAEAYQARTRFLRLQSICKRYFSALTYHLSATYGAMLGKGFAFDMVRIGIGLYGYLPDGVSGFESEEKALKLKKGMSVYAYAVGTRKPSFGGVGYTKPLNKNIKRLAVYRVGYADGFLRKQQNGMHGWKKNANCLCMDACLRKGYAKKGQRTLILQDAHASAEAAKTISYEVLCAATKRAERIYEYT